MNTILEQIHYLLECLYRGYSKNRFFIKISTKKLLESFALNAEERIIEDEDISRDDEKDNPDEDKRFVRIILFFYNASALRKM